MNQMNQMNQMNWTDSSKSAVAWFTYALPLALASQVPHCLAGF